MQSDSLSDIYLVASVRGYVSVTIECHESECQGENVTPPCEHSSTFAAIVWANRQVLLVEEESHHLSSRYHNLLIE